MIDAVSRDRSYSGSISFTRSSMDPLIDLAIAGCLLKNSNWIRVTERQARVFIEIGDAGYSTSTFARFLDYARSGVADLYRRRNIDSAVVEEKARRVWGSVVHLFSSRFLLSRSGVDLDLFPEIYRGDLYSLIEVASWIISRTLEIKRGGSRVPIGIALRRAVRELDVEQSIQREVAPLLWWINLAVESEALEKLFRIYHHAYMKKETINASAIKFRSVSRVLNALVFIEHFRPGIHGICRRRDSRLRWFLYSEILTYMMAVYLFEIQRLAGVERAVISISDIITPRKGYSAGRASALASLILLSPIYMQYRVEAGGSLAVTPADIAVAVLRIIRRRGRMDDFVVGVQEVSEEIAGFWREADLFGRVQSYSGGSTPNDLYRLRSFTNSLALLINLGVDGIHISTMEKPVLKLPPRMIGYDSIFVRSRRFIPILSSVFG